MFIENQKVNDVKYETKRKNTININNFEKFRDFSLFNNLVFEMIIFALSQLQFIREFFFSKINYNSAKKSLKIN